MMKNDIEKIYEKRSRHYNITTSLLYNFVGLRVNKHRKLAVESINLKKGDTVVEIGCGTGSNFSYLQKAVCSNGKIIGVDLTSSMLAEAKDMIDKNGWKNVELIQSDAASFEFPKKVNGILSTFAITMVPEFDQVILNGSKALLPRGKWVIMDFKLPTNWLAKFSPILVLLIQPYGGTLEMADRHPWKSLQKYLLNVSMNEFWGGMAYIACGVHSKGINI